MLIEIKTVLCKIGSEFTCGNGICIPIEQRCDKKMNCNDGSDERNCRKCYSKTPTTIKIVTSSIIYFRLVSNSTTPLCFNFYHIKMKTAL